MRSKVNKRLTESVIRAMNSDINISNKYLQLGESVLRNPKHRKLVADIITESGKLIVSDHDVCALGYAVSRMPRINEDFSISLILRTLSPIAKDYFKDIRNEIDDDNSLLTNLEDMVDDVEELNDQLENDVNTVRMDLGLDAL